MYRKEIAASSRIVVSESTLVAKIFRFERSERQSELGKDLSLRFFSDLVLFRFVLLPMLAHSRWKLYYFGFVCLSCCNRNFCFFSFSFLKRNSQVTTQFSPTLQRCHSECVSCLQRVCFIFRMNFTLTKFFYCSMDESSSCTTAATSVQIWVSISLRL